MLHESTLRVIQQMRNDRIFMPRQIIFWNMNIFYKFNRGQIRVCAVQIMYDVVELRIN